jgi:hypothetical protein
MSIIGNTSGWNIASADVYDGQRYYAEQERSYREQMELERDRMYRTMNSYNPNTDTYGGVSAQQMQEAPKPKRAAQPAYLDNNKLLLLEN